MRTFILVVLAVSGLATCVSAQQPVITSFESDGTLTWSNAYSNAIASVERLSDVATTGSTVTVTETLAVSDGSTLVYNYTVEHPPIVNPSVTISDGTYSWTEAGSSDPGVFLAQVGSYESGQVSAVYLSGPPATGTVIDVEYAYLPTSTTQIWLAVHYEEPTSEVAVANIEVEEPTGFFRVGSLPSPMVLIPGGSNAGMNPLGIFLGDPEWHDPCWFPANYSLSVDAFYMSQYEVTNDEMLQVMQWAYDSGYVYVTTGTSSAVRNSNGDQQDLLVLSERSCRLTWDGRRFGIKESKGSGHPCVEVTWYGAVAYCNYRSLLGGRTPCYDLSDWSYELGADGYRLPTSEEWEYAARGGLVSKRFPWGDTISYSQANYTASEDTNYDMSCCTRNPCYEPGSPWTCPVGTYAANDYGLYDMAGNVREWCTDLHPCSVTARVTRGGDLAPYVIYCRVGNIGNQYPQFGSEYLGFRIMRSAGQ